MAHPHIRRISPERVVGALLDEGRERLPAEVLHSSRTIHAPSVPFPLAKRNGLRKRGLGLRKPPAPDPAATPGGRI